MNPEFKKIAFFHGIAANDLDQLIAVTGPAGLQRPNKPLGNILQEYGLTIVQECVAQVETVSATSTKKPQDHTKQHFIHGLVRGVTLSKDAILTHFDPIVGLLKEKREQVRVLNAEVAVMEQEMAVVIS